MEEIPSNLRYSESHEWVKVENNKARIGITHHAQKELTDIVYVELPKIGEGVKKDGEIGVVESIKAVSEIYSPISGKVVEVNNKLEESPELINKHPYADGWLTVFENINKKEIEELMSAEEYTAFLEEIKAH
ncbi:MAG: glycine cleavage system protein GcvH [Thermoplasmata archaeon]